MTARAGAIVLALAAGVAASFVGGRWVAADRSASAAPVVSRVSPAESRRDEAAAALSGHAQQLGPALARERRAQELDKLNELPREQILASAETTPEQVKLRRSRVASELIAPKAPDLAPEKTQALLDLYEEMSAARRQLRADFLLGDMRQADYIEASKAAMRTLFKDAEAILTPDELDRVMGLRPGGDWFNPDDWTRASPDVDKTAGLEPGRVPEPAGR